MERRTINGKPIQEVFQKLKEDIPGVIKMTNETESKPYLDAMVMRQFFDEQIPVSNYDFTLTDVQFIQFGERSCFVCTGTITVYDDEGKKVITKSYTGSNNCIIAKSTGQAVDLAMEGCIALFGCGERQIEQAKAKNKGRNQYGNTSSGQRSQAPVQQNASPVQNPAASTSQRKQPPTGKGNFLLVYDSSKEIKNLPRMILIPVKCREYQNYETKLLIWRDRHKDVDSIVNRIATGIGFCCEGKFESYSNDYRIVLDKMDGTRA